MTWKGEMKRTSAMVVLALAGCGSTASSSQTANLPPAAGPRPPVAARRPYQIKSPNGERDDPYYWLRDDTRKDPDVLGYLNAENAYGTSIMAADQPLQDRLLAELKSHVPEIDMTAPVLDDGYWYYMRFAAGQEQPIYARRKGSMDAAEQVVLDGNALARGHAFFAFGGQAVSRNGQLVAWTDDTVGRRQYVLHIKDLATGQQLADTATNVGGELVWANDDKTVLYVGKDPTTLREDRVFRHTLGAAAVDDALVLREPDGQYYVSVQPTKSRRYIVILLDATTNSEAHVVDADRPETP